MDETETESMSIDEFIQFCFPPPQEGDQDYRFYTYWGYEQWLIKSKKHDMVQMRILMHNAYTQYQFEEWLDGLEGNTPEDKLRGRPLVRAKHRIQRFLCATVAKGDPGILLWSDPNGHYCYMTRRNLLPNIKTYLSDEDVEITDVLFESEDQLTEMLRENWGFVSSPGTLSGRYAKLPGYDSVMYIDRARMWDFAGSRWWAECAPALLRKSGKGWKKPKKSDIEMKWFDAELLEEVEILQ